MEISRVWGEVTPGIGGISWSQQDLYSSIANAFAWGVVEQHHILAFVIFRQEAHAIEVDYLATSKEHQRKGYMSYIFKHLKDLSQNQAKPIWLEVSENNKKAVRFYEELGFIKGAIRKNYYKNGQNAYIYSYNT